MKVHPALNQEIARDDAKIYTPLNEEIDRHGNKAVTVKIVIKIIKHEEK